MNKQELIKEIEKNFIKNIPRFRPGDIVRVHVRVTETRYNQKTRKWEEKTRIQPYEGMIIKIRGSGVGKTITVRKVSQGIGVERIFPIYSPTIEKIEVVKRHKPKRAVLTFVRNLSEKEMRKKFKELKE
ncbi:MAG: 50S ribosomal protein L19 [candidate division WOR-3 bacterium]|nr:50S ribosomal protein L19 [candidate division WOR-3 bacterium]MDW8150971.1 50S ribosomal protein L19 [candidate division WOR-3 bacterium]